MIEGSSTDPDIFKQVSEIAKSAESVLVTLDSNHSYEHVLKEMNLYGKLVTQGSYMVVMDGAQQAVHDIPNGKPEWIEDNPLRAVNQYLHENSSWEVDEYYNRMIVGSNPRGYLKKTTHHTNSEG